MRGRVIRGLAAGRNTCHRVIRKFRNTPAILVIGPIASFAATALIASALADSAESPSFSVGPESALGCRSGEPIRVELTEYADAPGVVDPSSPTAARNDYLGDFRPDVKADEFTTVAADERSALFVDTVDERPQAAALAIRREGGWRVTAFAECRGYARTDAELP